MLITKTINLNKLNNIELFGYLYNLSKLSKNLYNTCLFYINNTMTGVSKQEYPEERYQNEIEIMHNVIISLSKQDKFSYPTRKNWFLNYYKLNYILTYHKNECYYNIPAQLSQSVIKQACNNYQSYFKALQEYKKNPTKFKNRPRKPKYIKKETISYSLTNQLCKIKYNNNNKGFLSFPKTKLKIKLGKLVKQEETLKEVKIKLINKETIKISLVIADGIELPTKQPMKNIIGIDLGIDNLVAISNNININPLLINGKVLKSYNQYFNKRVAYYKSIAKKVNQKESTKRIEKLYLKRENYINNYLHQVSNYIMKYCNLNKIDTIIIGYNKDWKTNCNMGQTTQTFVQIPYLKLINMIAYKGDKKGFNMILQEESYTSKASFLDNDEIAIYKKKSKKPIFSGKRIKRGLYKTKSGILINSDINGACNIIKKYIKKDFINENLLKVEKVTLKI